MNKILCPTDLSDAAHSAIAYAGKLSKATGCSLTLLHVKSVFDLTLAGITGSNAHSAAGITDQLEEQCREISKTFKISCNAEVVSKLSKLSSVINEVAKGYDLIVMGSNGADDLYQVFGGSNTYNAIVKSDTPLLLIPEGYTYCEIKTMVYAYDYLHERKLPLVRLVPFIKALNSKLTVLQVMEEAYSKEAEEDLEELQFIIKTLYDEDLHYEYKTIRSSEVARSIDSYILRTQPDVLVLCSVHKNPIGSIFHKSVIKNISALSKYPVYVFHQ
jgi:nucleotide-binding universal stress UspA family protein